MAKDMLCCSVAAAAGPTFRSAPQALRTKTQLTFRLSLPTFRPAPQAFRTTTQPTFRLAVLFLFLVVVVEALASPRGRCSSTDPILYAPY